MKEKELEVIYEDNHLLVVNKPAGMLVQGDKTGDVPLVEHGKAYIKEKYQKPGAVFLGVVHRLDRPVSGAVVLARTSKALGRMSELFRQNDVKKTYWAVVRQRPYDPEGSLTHWLVKDTTRNIAKAHNKPVKGGKEATLSYKLLAESNGFYLLEIHPLSGRPHQIRVQLASMGCPIRGDVKYGFDRPNEDGNINLHARCLEFVHPVKKQSLSLFAELPQDDFWQLFRNFAAEEKYNG